MENLNKKSWFSENAKSILIIIGFIVLWIILRILGVIFKRWPLYFILHGLNNDVPHETEENNSIIFENKEENKKTTFEKKELCMKYYDTYRNYLINEYEGNIEKGDTLKYEMFYNSELNTCISAYGVLGMRVIDGESYKDQIFRIVDYFNGEKELYSCRENPHLFGVDKDCEGEWEIEKEIYKE